MIEAVEDIAGSFFVDHAFIAELIGDDEVVFEDIAVGIGDDKFAMKIVGAEAEAVIAHDSVVKNLAINDAAAVAVVAADAEADFVVVVEEVIAGDDVAGDPAGIFGAEFHA